MKKLLLFCSLITFSFSLSAQTWLWGRDGSGLKTEATSVSVATDLKGNAYVAGVYQGGITFGSFSIGSVSNYASYIVKYNSAGTAKWLAQPIGSDRNVCYASSVTTDLNGNVFLTGIFSDTEKFGAFKLVNPYHSNQDIFLAKYDSNGNVIWATQAIPNTDGNYGVNSVATDKNGNSYITGWFQDSIHLGSFILTGLSTNENIFLAKYDKSGNVLWAKQSDIPNVNCQAYASSICADLNGDVYITGNFQDSLKVGSYKFYGISSTFIVKYDSNGNVIWARVPFGNSLDIGNSITADKLGNVYIAGYFTDTLVFGVTTLSTPINTAQIFYAKYDTTGNVLWAKQSTSASSYWQAWSIVLDSALNIYIGGNNYNGNATPVTFGSVALTPIRSYDSFILKCDNTGTPMCGALVGNGVYNGVTAKIAGDYSGRFLYLSGTQDDTIIYAPNFLIPTGIEKDSYLVRWSPCGISNPESINELQLSNSGVVLYPNPSDGNFTIELSAASGQSTVEVYNMLGELIYSKQFSTLNGKALTSSPNNNSSSNSQLSIDLNSNANGIYLYRVLNEKGNVAGEGKFVIQR